MSKFYFKNTFEKHFFKNFKNNAKDQNSPQKITTLKYPSMLFNIK
jgi:hypothetical protein